MEVVSVDPSCSSWLVIEPDGAQFVQFQAAATGGPRFWPKPKVKTSRKPLQPSTFRTMKSQTRRTGGGPSLLCGSFFAWSFFQGWPPRQISRPVTESSLCMQDWKLLLSTARLPGLFRLSHYMLFSLSTLLCASNAIITEDLEMR